MICKAGMSSLALWEELCCQGLPFWFGDVAWIKACLFWYASCVIGCMRICSMILSTAPCEWGMSEHILNKNEIKKKKKNKKRRTIFTRLNKRRFRAIVKNTVAIVSLLDTRFWANSADYGDFVDLTSSLRLL